MVKGKPTMDQDGSCAPGILLQGYNIGVEKEKETATHKPGKRVPDR